MDPFSAATGVVGIASLGIQIAGVLSQILNFWKSVKNASKNVKQIIQDLEMLDEVLNSIMLLNQRLSTDVVTYTISPMTHTLRNCFLRLRELGNMVEILEAEIRSRRLWGGIKASLKDASIREFQRGLESAKSSLLLANQQFHHQMQATRHQSLLRQQYNITRIVLSINEQLTLIPMTTRDVSQPESAVKTNVASDTCQIAGKPDQKPHDERPGCKVDSEGKSTCPQKQRTRPTLILKRAFNVYKQMALQDKRIISTDSPVFECARSGDVERLWNLFDQGLASPFDTDAYDWTPLHCAALNLHPFMCKILLDLGADCNARTRFGISPLALISNIHPERSGKDGSNILRVTRMLLENGDADPFVTSGGGIPACYTYRGNKDGLQLMLNQTPCEDKPGERTLYGWNVLHEQAVEYEPWDQELIGDRFDFWIRHGADVNARITYQLDSDPDIAIESTPLHVTCVYVFCLGPPALPSLSGLSKIFGPLLHAGADLHAVDGRKQTPLRLIGQRQDSCLSFYWLMMLENFGVDLIDYIEVENSIYTEIDNTFKPWTVMIAALSYAAKNLELRNLSCAGLFSSLFPEIEETNGEFLAKGKATALEMSSDLQKVSASCNSFEQQPGYQPYDLEYDQPPQYQRDEIMLDAVSGLSNVRGLLTRKDVTTQFYLIP